MKNHPAAKVKEAALYFLPVKTRMPLKFGTEVLTSVTCARVMLRVEDQRGRSAVGWGETPLSVQWVWPSALPYEERHAALKDFCAALAKAWAGFDEGGHALDVGHAFLEDALPKLLGHFNGTRKASDAMPYLAALVCCSAFDIALHDAFGNLLQLPVYALYGREYFRGDLARFYRPASRVERAMFKGRVPADFFVIPPPRQLRAWHLVGGKDPLIDADLDGSAPHDGHPVTLTDWIKRDGLKCLKIKLRGNDADWDYSRLVAVGRLALAAGVEWLSSDFNCTVTDPEYVNEILDRLMREHPAIYGALLYVERPFPYELEEHKINVRSVSARKPLFMDESAHDWRLVRLGYQLGWSGVALKTCKTQTGALLTLCWAKAHGMPLMVQDLTNPMLAQIPHVQLAAYAGTIMGVETNSMQFYPEASNPEAAVHPGLYARRAGILDLSSLQGPGFGYRVNEIARVLPPPAAAY